MSYAHLGRIEEAQKEMRIVLALRPDFTIAGWNDDPIGVPELRKLMIDGMRLAWMPEG
jgi:hypothetical protein